MPMNEHAAPSVYPLRVEGEQVGVLTLLRKRGEAAFDDDVNAIGKGVGSDAPVDDVVGLCAVGHLERHFPSARIAYDRAVDDSRAASDAPGG